MLYICSTPIGNLKDITIRALEILKISDVILCEDTRVSKNLLNFYQINHKKLISFHEHNEREITEKVISWLREGLTITQITDAGTPSISDPGSKLCDEVINQGFAISPLPGASAYISLYSIAGIKTPCLFYGFLPATSSKRCEILLKWKEIDYAICIYEAPHRIIKFMEDLVNCLGNDREIMFGRELTKQFETIKKLSALNLLDFIRNDLNQTKGEITLIIYPPKLIIKNNSSLNQIQKNTLISLADELPPKKAVNLTNKLVGGGKEELYNFLLSLK